MWIVKWDCMLNFKWPLQRWQCQIYYGTLKSFYDQEWIRYNCLSVFKFFIFIWSFSAIALILIRNYQILILFESEKRPTVSSSCLIRLRFQGYRCPLQFAWRVTLIMVLYCVPSKWVYSSIDGGFSESCNTTHKDTDPEKQLN